LGGVGVRRARDQRLFPGAGSASPAVPDWTLVLSSTSVLLRAVLLPDIATEMDMLVVPGLAPTPHAVTSAVTTARPTGKGI